MYVENMVSGNGNKVANQFIITDTNRIVFQSYDTVIAVMFKDSSELHIFREWNYSQTTLKYFKEFLRINFRWIGTKLEIQKLIDKGEIGAYKIVYFDK